MTSPVAKKLKCFCELSASDIYALNQITKMRVQVDAGNNITHVGSKNARLRFVLEGYAVRKAFLPNGRTLVLSILIPGDEIIAPTHLSSYQIHTITDVLMCSAGPKRGDALLARAPALAEAMHKSICVAEATLHERAVSLGVRTAKEQVLHLFCELFTRHKNVGKTKDMTLQLPFTQNLLAELNGMSMVHFNRTLMAIRADEAMKYENGQLTIHDWERMQEDCFFDSSYLYALSTRYPLRKMAS